LPIEDFHAKEQNPYARKKYGAAFKSLIAISCWLAAWVSASRPPWKNRIAFARDDYARLESVKSGRCLSGAVDCIFGHATVGLGESFNSCLVLSAFACYFDLDYTILFLD
jgi:hypothetical protein